MSIPVTCPECQSYFHVGDEFAGLAGRCPDCTAVLRVPDPAPSDHPVEPAEASPYRPPPARAEAFEPAPVPPPMPRRDRPRRDGRREVELRADYDDRPRRPGFDPRERAERWARVHRGLGYLQVAVVLGFASQILQTTLMIARGGVPENPHGMIDSGQLALGFGALLMIVAAGMFWLLGRAAGLRTPYVPARKYARASFLMALGAIAGVVVGFCSFVTAVVAAAPAANGGGPPPGALVVMLLSMLALGLTFVLAVGAEVTGLMALGQIGDALRDKAAAGWARRTIVVIFLAGGLIVLGVCATFVYLMSQEQQRLQNQGRAGVAADDPDKAKDQAGEKGKAKATDKPARADQGKDADADPPVGAEADGEPEPIDETVALVFNLVYFIPLIVYLIHYSVALQGARRAIRREIDVLTGRDHGEHDRHF